MPRGSDKCRCAACQLYFNSTYAFDRHRVGQVGKPDRHCLSADELTAAGWVLSPTGHWKTPRRGVFREKDAGGIFGQKNQP